MTQNYKVGEKVSVCSFGSNSLKHDDVIVGVDLVTVYSYCEERQDFIIGTCLSATERSIN